ncbi:MAG: pimeloyl-ACP methyl ester esterase BioH [Pseudomonadota bacterium]|nr:pimeloyl-ACP methyl ester esterase BioH [Pseudomonadota bacterium]
MHIEQRGSGPDLVMLHGWSMHSGVWHELADRLANRFTLHLVDLPGHGLSDWQPAAFDLDNLLPALADKLPQRAVWLGWSLGGLLSLAFAQQYPARISKLNLMAATPRFVQGPDWPCAMQSEIFENFAASLDVNQKQTLQRFLMLQAKGADNSRAAIRDLSERLALQHSPAPAALQAGLDCLLKLDMREALANLSCPVQLLLGTRDTLIPAAMAEYARRLNPALQVVMLEGLGHAPFIAQAAECQQQIEQFIDG